MNIGIIIALSVLLFPQQLANASLNMGQQVVSGVATIVFPTEAASVRTRQYVLQRLQSQAKLTTLEVKATEFDVRVNVKRWIFDIGGYGASHFAQGTVSLGVNLNREDLEVQELGPSHFKVTLPPVEVISCAISMGRQYDQSTTIFADWQSLEEIALYEATRLFVNQAIDDEARLEEARQRARQTVRDLLDAVGVEAEVVFKEGAVRIADTCRAAQPRDWHYDEVAQKWERR